VIPGTRSLVIVQIAVRSASRVEVDLLLKLHQPSC
jgi:hypothetical protein